MTSFYIFLLLSLLLLGFAVADPDYHERLVLQPLAPASLLASFNFRSNASLESFEQQHFKYIPRSLGQILQHAKTRELHLRFSTGRWDAESWGARPWGGAKEGGTGVELWAWIEADTDSEAFARWTTLTNAVSGLFCASLNFIDSTRTTRPRVTFEPTGHHLNGSNLHLLHGTLPREVVCTENLTPFLKLLPCKGKAGISSLLDGHKLFDASWQSMAIDIRPVRPSDESECIIEMEQTVDMVLDIQRSKRPRDNPIPRPIPNEDLVCDTSKPYSSEVACYPIDQASGQSWSLSEIFGRPMKGSCLADDSDPSVCINVPHSRDVYASSGAYEIKNAEGTSRCFTFPPNDPFEIILPQQTNPPLDPVQMPPLYASRSFTGHGAERGGVQSTVTNPSSTDNATFIYFESLPWFMKPYLHTLTAHLSSQNTSLKSSSSNLIKEIYYRPALDRVRGIQLELIVSIPPASTVTLAYDFDKAILRYTEYPPDANRGFDIAPAIIRLLPNGASTSSPPSSPPSSQAHAETPTYLRTTSLLLPLPTPDFSMPYNVIILTSTVMALAFGSIFTILVRRFVAADEVEGWDWRAVREKIKARSRVLTERFGGTDKEKKAQ